METLELLKLLLTKKYNTKNLGKVKTIIRQQITRNSTIGTIKINQLAFIRNLVIKKNITNYNTLVILVKARLSIKIVDLNNYKEIKLYKQQWLIGKFIYFVYKIKPNRAFVVEQLSKQNVNLKNNYLKAVKRVV